MVFIMRLSLKKEKHKLLIRKWNFHLWLVKNIGELQRQFYILGDTEKSIYF